MSTLTIPTLTNQNPFSFQGIIYLAKLLSGVPQKLWWVGNCPKADFAPNVTRRQHRESYSGNRTIDRTRFSAREAKLTLTLEDINKENIAVGLLGKKVTTAGGSITAETFPSALVVGDVVKLKYPNASAIVITDSAGSPATLTLNTHYKVLDAKKGTIEILSLTGTQPYKAAYTAAAVPVITGLEGDDSDEYYVLCDLLNTEPATDQAIALEIYKVQIDPTKLISLINAEGGSFDLECSAMRDLTRGTDTEFGGYFRWIYNDANS